MGFVTLVYLFLYMFEILHIENLKIKKVIIHFTF